MPDHAERGQGGRWSSAWRVVVAVVLLLLSGLAAYAFYENKTDPPSGRSVQALIEQAGLGDRLRIGVYEDQPAMSCCEKSALAGFDVEIARLVARELGYSSDRQIDWRILGSDTDRIDFLVSGTVDLVVASFSMTPAREQQVSFSGPYLTTHQAVLTTANRRIDTVAGLAALGGRLCASAGSTSESVLVGREVAVAARNTDRECFEGLRSGQYAAMTSDETILAGFKGLEPQRYSLWRLADAGGEEPLGIGVPRGNDALKRLVDHILTKSYRQQGPPPGSAATSWQQAYRKYLAPALKDRRQDPPREPTDLLDYDSKEPGR